MPSGTHGIGCVAGVLHRMHLGSDSTSEVQINPNPPILQRVGYMSGKLDEIKGRVKEAVGDLSDNQKLKDSGKADKAAGKVKQGAEHAVDKIRDTIKKP